MIGGVIVAQVVVPALTHTALAVWVDREVEGQGRLPALSAVVAGAEAEFDLGRVEGAEAWLSDARWRALIPMVDARFGTDRSLDVRDATTTSWVRTGEGFGVQVRVRWAFADALFNDSVLRVEKALRERNSARWKARERLVKLYFHSVELEIRRLSEPGFEASVDVALADALLRAVTGQRAKFGTRATNPWPGTQP